MATPRPSGAIDAPHSTDPRELLTVDEVADILKVGRTTVYELLNSGDLPSVTIRRCRRILPSDLNTYIASMRAEVAHA
jgi:excisionase family DNA binding protein